MGGGLGRSTPPTLEMSPVLNEVLYYNCFCKTQQPEHQQQHPLPAPILLKPRPETLDILLNRFRSGSPWSAKFTNPPTSNYSVARAPCHWRTATVLVPRAHFGERGSPPCISWCVEGAEEFFFNPGCRGLPAGLTNSPFCSGPAPHGPLFPSKRIHSPSSCGDVL